MTKPSSPFTPPPVRWGVIGCGQIALDKSVPGLLAAENARVQALAEPLAPRLALVQEICAVQPGAPPRVYDDYHALLRDPDVDVVYVALPTGMHVEAVLAAAAAGKPLLCEKPMGRSAPETRRMIRAARNAAVPLMTAYMSRFSDVFQEAVRVLADGGIGAVTFVYANFSYPALGPYPPGAPGGWRWTDAEGGGAVLDIGVYLAFALREMLGDEVATVSNLHCSTVAPPGLPIPDSTVAWFQTRKGIPGAFAATFSHAESRMVFYGTEGRLELTQCFNQTPTGKMELHAGAVHRVQEQPGEPMLPHYNNYRREFEHFSQALLTGAEYHPTPLEALTDALLLDALRQIPATGAGVTVPEAQFYLEEIDNEIGD